MIAELVITSFSSQQKNENISGHLFIVSFPVNYSFQRMKEVYKKKVRVQLQTRYQKLVLLLMYLAVYTPRRHATLGN